MTRAGGVLRRLYVVLGGPHAQGGCPSRYLKRAFVHLNHMADLYLFCEDPIAQWDELHPVLDSASRFISEFGFMRLQVRPVHPVPAGKGDELLKMYMVVSSMGSAFHQEALGHQVASRWMVLPVLRARSEPEVEEAMKLAPRLRDRMILPSLSLPPSPRLGQWVTRLDLERERILIEDMGSPLEEVFRHDLLDDLLAWSISPGGGFSVEPCRALVLDFLQGRLSICPWQQAQPMDERCGDLSSPAEASVCLGCWDQLPSRLEDVIRWNRREEEGARVCHQLGLFAMLRGEPEKAASHLVTSAQLASHVQLKAESLLYLGILKRDQGHLEEASRFLREALSLRPGSGTILYHLARCELDWKDFIAASELFDAALEAGVGKELHDELRLQLAICHINLEEFGEAWQALENVEKPTPPVCFYRGLALLGQGRAEEALEHLEQALALGPDEEDLGSVLFYLGYCLKEMGRFQEASSFLQRALKADPTSYEAWNLLGYCRFKLGLHHEAIEAFLRALQIRPGSAIDLANIGSSLRELGESREAAAWYRKALSRDPTLAFAADGLRKLEEKG